MDLTLFGPQSPGEIVRVDSQLSAFVPAPLPPRSWELPASLWPLLAEAKAKLASVPHQHSGRLGAVD